MNDREEFLEACATLLEALDDLPEDVYARGAEFFDSVKEKTESMQARVEAGAPATGSMCRAVDNMAQGVEKWLQ